MFIHYQIKNGDLGVTEEHLLNCDHIISARYIPAYHKYVPAEESDDGEEHHSDVKSILKILTTELEVTTTEVEDGVLGAATQSTTIKFRGDEADNVWNLLVANVNALEQF